MVSAAVFKQDFLNPGTYRPGGQELSYSADDLREFADNSNRMLTAGIKIPVFPFHPEAGTPEGGPRKPSDQIDVRDLVGDVVAFGQNPDGSLWHKLRIHDEDCAARLRDKRVEWTSPELRNYVSPTKTEGGFEEYGRIVRHVALTPKPINQRQGPIVALSEGAENMSPQFSQFSMLDKFENDEYDKDQPEKDDAALEATVSAVENVDGRQVATQVLNDLETAGIAAPRGVDPVTDPLAFLQQLSAALRQKAIADAENASKDNDGDELEVREEPGLAQYSEPESEEDMKAAEQLKAKNEALAKRNAELVAQFSESKRDGLRERIKGSKYPTFLRDELLTRVDTVQFSEDGTTKQALKVEDALDLFDRMAKVPNVTFADGDVSEAEHPDGEAALANEDLPEGHMTAEQADKIADDLNASGYHEPKRELTPAVAE